MPEVDEQLERLSAALEGRYRIERELGEGDVRTGRIAGGEFGA